MRGTRRGANVTAGDDVVVVLELSRQPGMRVPPLLRRVFDHRMRLNVIRAVPAFAKLSDHHRSIVRGCT